MMIANEHYMFRGIKGIINNINWGVFLKTSK